MKQNNGLLIVFIDTGSTRREPRYCWKNLPLASRNRTFIVCKNLYPFRNDNTLQISAEIYFSDKNFRGCMVRYDFHAGLILMACHGYDFQKPKRPKRKKYLFLLPIINKVKLIHDESKYRLK